MTRFGPTDADLDERRRERGEQLGRKQLPIPLFDASDLDDLDEGQDEEFDTLTEEEG